MKKQMIVLFLGVFVALVLVGCGVEIKREFYENGNLKSEIPYKDDKENGVAKRYYENGKLRIETPLKDDKANGVAKVYGESEDLVAQFDFNDDHFTSGKCINGKELTDVHYIEWRDGTKIEKLCK